MSRVLALTASVLAVTAACGEDEYFGPSVDGSVNPDAAPGPDAPDGPPMPTALFVGGSGTTGSLTRVDVVAGTVTPNALAGVAGGDTVIRRIGDETFIINRLGGDNVTVLGGEPLALVDQFSTGMGTNPQDVAVVGNKLYIPAYETEGVVVIDRTTRVATRIDLQSAAMDTDGMPDCATAYAVGNRVFVACQRMNRAVMPWAPRGRGYIVVIDATTDTVLPNSFALRHANPFGHFVATPAGGFFGGDLLITTVTFGDYSTGCLERISTGATPALGACAATNAALGGSVAAGDAAPTGGKLWLAVQRYELPQFDEFGHLRSIDLATGAVSAPITPESGAIRDVAACPGGYVVATDGTVGAAGLRIWRDGTETTPTPLGLGREPALPDSLVCY